MLASDPIGFAHRMFLAHTILPRGETFCPSSTDPLIWRTVQPLSITREVSMRWLTPLLSAFLVLGLVEPVSAQAPAPKLADYFPQPESKGGWRSLLPKTGSPDAKQKE